MSEEIRAEIEKVVKRSFLEQQRLMSKLVELVYNDFIESQGGKTK